VAPGPPYARHGLTAPFESLLGEAPEKLSRSVGDQNISGPRAIIFPVYRLYPQAIPAAFGIKKLERAPCTLICPAGIPLGVLYKKGNALVKERFDYETGWFETGLSPWKYLGEEVTLETKPR